MDATNSFQDYYSQLEKRLQKATNDEELFESIVNAPFINKFHSTSIDLGMIVLILANHKTNLVERVAYSKTPSAIDAAKGLPIKFNEIKIPLKHKNNITSKAVRTGKAYKTSDWYALLTPAIGRETARFNQAEAGIGCSYVYPLLGARDGGALIYSFYQPIDMISTDHHMFMKRYSDFVATQLKNPLSK